MPTLERAFTEVVRRHEALRTVFRLVDGEPRQIVQPPYPVRIEMRRHPRPRRRARGRGDASARPSPARARGRSTWPTGRCVRVHLIRVSEADYALLVNMHHIVTDGWSMPIVMREMDELYDAYARGLPYPLPRAGGPVPGLQRLAARVPRRATRCAQQVDYWRSHLEGAPTLELPTDRPRPPVLTYRGSIYRFVWPAALTRAHPRGGGGDGRRP